MRKLIMMLCLSGSFMAYGENVTKAELKNIFERSGVDLYAELINLWKTKAPFNTQLENITLKLTGCYGKSKIKAWADWRYEGACAEPTLPDDFRRMAISSLEQSINTILSQLQVTPAITSEQNTKNITWIAIGTPGPGSDIDTVANANIKDGAEFPKIVVENMAKSLFDTLGIALYDQATGVTFDTESYIDVTADLNKEKYTERIKNSAYKNLAFTLAFVQIARQLQHHPVRIGSSEVFKYDDFKAPWKESPDIYALLKDANEFQKATQPKDDPKDNIKTYLPIINHLGRVAAKFEETDDIEASKIKGILGTYFPEAYYTREALAHVCYSDDRYSQLLLSKASEYLKKNKSITKEQIDAFKAQAISPTRFIYLVSALENFGYFLHKLNGQQNFYKALKESSKYLFRVARALAGYWQVDTEIDLNQSNQEELKNQPEKYYVANFFNVASKLERLKRGFLPFSSIDDVQKIITKIQEDFMSTKEKVIRGLMKENHANKYAGATTKKLFNNALLAYRIYTVHLNIYLSKTEKETKLQEIAQSFGNMIRWRNNQFDLAEESVMDGRPIKEIQKEQEDIDLMPTSPEKREKIKGKLEKFFKKRAAALELASLFNLIIGIDNNTPAMQAQKNIEEQRFKEESKIPLWRSGASSAHEVELLSTRTLTPEQFSSFLSKFNSFLKYTVDDYKTRKASKFKFSPVELKVKAVKEIDIANVLPAAH